MNVALAKLLNVGDDRIEIGIAERSPHIKRDVKAQMMRAMSQVQRDQFRDRHRAAAAHLDALVRIVCEHFERGL